MCRSRKSIAEGLENIDYCLVGILLLHWEIRLDSGEKQWEHEVVTVGPNVKRSRAKAQACVQYVIDDALRCDPYHLECPGDRWNRDFLRALKARCVVMPRVAAFLEGVGQDIFDVAVVSTALALLMVEGLLPLSHWVPVFRRQKRDHWPMKARPTKAQLHRFRVNHGLGDEGTPALGSADPLPPSRLAALNFTTDPVDVLRFINATLHLKDLRHTGRVFTNIAKAMWPDQAYAMLLHAQSDGLHIPCRRLLIEGRARLDVACMLLDRRLLSGHQFLGYHERSTHIYCDSSPITGRELFCVFADFYVAPGRRYFRELPPASMGLGYCTLENRCFAVLWSLWLMAGPRMDVMEALLETVRSFTTDQGCEAGLPHMQNILPRFAAALGLSVSAQWESRASLFPWAVHIPDWDHLWSNTMKLSFEAIPGWLGHLSSLRELCTFLRNNDHREDALRYIFAQGDPRFTEGSCGHMKHFTASFTRWRYNTLSDVYQQVGPWRTPIETWFVADMFKQKEKPTTVLHIARDALLWKLVDPFTTITWVCEECRCWGGGCPCHEEERKRHRVVECDRTGLRLDEASDTLKEVLGDLQRNLDSQTLDQCEGSSDALLIITFLLRRLISEIRERFAWVDKLPYLLARVRQPSVAREIVRQYHEAPRNAHHPVTIRAMDSWLREIEEIATSTDAVTLSLGLATEEKAFKRMPLSSRCAEGFHRGARLTKVRASSASLPWIFSTSRLAKNLELAMELVSTEEGANQFRYDFVNFTRILQTQPGIVVRCHETFRLDY